MKHYEKLIELGCFSRQMLAETVGSEPAAASTIYEYLKKGYIERVRHDLYTVISLETKQPVLSRYQIGASLFPDACITHHSAFEVFGYANQAFYETYVSTKSRFPDFDYNGISYRRVSPKRNAVTTMHGTVPVTSLEQTVVDSISDFEKIGGLEETLRCMLLIPALNSTKLLAVLKQYNNGFLYQKTGYLLQELNSSFALPIAFFEECAKFVPVGKRYFIKEKDGLIFHAQWKLYAPASIRSFIDKGVHDYDAI